MHGQRRCGKARTGAGLRGRGAAGRAQRETQRVARNKTWVRTRAIAPRRARERGEARRRRRCRRRRFPSLRSPTSDRSMLPLWNERPPPSSGMRNPRAQTSCTGLWAGNASTSTHDGSSSPPVLVWRSYLARRDGVSTNQACTLLTLVPRSATCARAPQGAGRGGTPGSQWAAEQARLERARGAGLGRRRVVAGDSAGNGRKVDRATIAPWAARRRRSRGSEAGRGCRRPRPRCPRRGEPRSRRRRTAGNASAGRRARADDECPVAKARSHLQAVENALERVRSRVQLGHMAGCHGDWACGPCCRSPGRAGRGPLVGLSQRPSIRWPDAGLPQS